MVFNYEILLKLLIEKKYCTENITKPKQTLLYQMYITTSSNNYYDRI